MCCLETNVSSNETLATLGTSDIIVPSVVSGVEFLVGISFPFFSVFVSSNSDILKPAYVVFAVLSSFPRTNGSFLGFFKHSPVCVAFRSDR